MLDKPVVVNNTPLVALWVLGHLDLYERLYGEILILQAVYQEFVATERALRQAGLDSAPWIKVVSLADPQHTRMDIGLDQGEAKVLALAQECAAWMLAFPTFLR
jgi:predicted nucleic acid-binding protein